jgi:hypothetical protein
MTMFSDLRISGIWINWGVSEDCWLVVGGRNTIELPEILGIEECYGVQTGTDYLDQLILSPALRDHLRDCICERLEV